MLCLSEYRGGFNNSVLPDPIPFMDVPMKKCLVLLLIALVLLSSPAHSAGLLRFDFNDARSAWPRAAAYAAPAAGVTAQVSVPAVGTIDSAGSRQASGGLLLLVNSAAARSSWTSGVVSGKLAVKNTMTDLGRLTLSFSLAASTNHPVRVRVESFDAARRRTGELETLIHPAAPDFYQRYALDLSTMRPVGGGKFAPTAPFVQWTFEIGSAVGDGWPAAPNHELRIDNVHYASPAYYVRPQGSDKNDGRTPATAFADPQKAVDVARPGDIILLMNGTYTRASTSSVHDGIVGFRRAGAPAAWIVLKNYPGHKPVLTSDGWNAIKIGRGTKANPSRETALAYLEVRGLHIRGNADVAKVKYPQDIGQPKPITNGNGISVDGRFEANIPHHVRFADNLVELCSGGGISTNQADWVTVEGNETRNNCWWMIYAGSGISLLGSSNFDATVGNYKALVRNNRTSGNRCYVPWAAIKKISDGNGIIIDSNHVPNENRSYLGRTLIQNNLSFNNGGSGIHAFKSHQIDIVNNTAYRNGASPELKWGQIFFQRTDDARMINNIIVAREGQPVNTVGDDISDKGNTNIVRAHNLYFGGDTPPIRGTDDVVADPQFVHPSTDHRVADFRVRPGSPAIDKGTRVGYGPRLDLKGASRSHGGAPDKGVYEFARAATIPQNHGRPR